MRIPTEPGKRGHMEPLGGTEPREPSAWHDYWWSQLPRSCGPQHDMFNVIMVPFYPVIMKESSDRDSCSPSELGMRSRPVVVVVDDAAP